MLDLVLLVAFILSIVLVATDAYRLEKQGVHIGGPAGWAVAMILIWIVAFPMYLVKREKHLEDETEVLLPKVAGWLLFFFTLGFFVFPHVQQGNADIADRLVNYTLADLVSEAENNGYSQERVQSLPRSSSSYEAPVFTSVIDPYPNYNTPNCRYEGVVEEGLPHGRGRHLCVIVGKGPVTNYEGRWKYGVYHGQGTRYYHDGSKYVGEWKDGERHGQGTYTLLDGRKFVGEFKEGKPHNGRGYLETRKGAGIEGEWRNGKVNGQGTAYNADGSVRRKGWWCDDVEYEIPCPDLSAGVLWTGGQFSNGKSSEFLTVVTVDGRKWVGQFKDGKPHGWINLYSANGALSRQGYFCTGQWSDSPCPD